MRRLLLLLTTLTTTASHAQFTLQASNTTASLRGIANVGGPQGREVAWASGTAGTVLRTLDGGSTWQTCATPPDAEKLDFRGIQAFDAQMAVVMSSGKGDLSRIYKTVDGCRTWKLVFTNPDAPQGFWDSVIARRVRDDSNQHCQDAEVILGTILGDPAVHKSNPKDSTTKPSFYLADFEIRLNCGRDVLHPSASSIFALPSQSAFAASNSLLSQQGPNSYWFAVGRGVTQFTKGDTRPSSYPFEWICSMSVPWSNSVESAGLFSVAIQPGSVKSFKPRKIEGAFLRGDQGCEKADMVVVGGDYREPEEMKNTAAYTAGSNKFRAAETPPHGYRSTVAYDTAHKTWITTGPNGTDISTDDGRTWQPLLPDSAKGDAPDADRNWNALSLPFVVGPKGRIGRLRADALPAMPSRKK